MFELVLAEDCTLFCVLNVGSAVELTALGTIRPVVELRTLLPNVVKRLLILDCAAIVLVLMLTAASPVDVVMFTIDVEGLMEVLEAMPAKIMDCAGITVVAFVASKANACRLFVELFVIPDVGRLPLKTEALVVCMDSFILGLPIVLVVTAVVVMSNGNPPLGLRDIVALNTSTLGDTIGFCDVLVPVVGIPDKLLPLVLLTAGVVWFVLEIPPEVGGPVTFIPELASKAIVTGLL